MTSRRRGLALLLAVTSGCYAAYPLGHKRAVRPTAGAGARLEMRAKNHTSWIRCGSDLTRCEPHDGHWERPVTSLRYYFYYDDKEITLGQYQALTDPTYDKRWDQIESKKGMCNVSIAPTVLYFAGAAAAIVGFALGGLKEDATHNEKLLTWGGMGVMVGGALISYPLGGYACRSAGKIAEGLEVKYALSPYEVSNNDNDERKIARMQATIEAFNRGELGRDQVAPTDAPPPRRRTVTTTVQVQTTAPEPPKVEAPPEPPPIHSDVLDAIAATGKFPTFLKAIEKGKLRELFKDGQTYTLLIPTEETFEKLGPVGIEARTTGEPHSSDAILWKQHVIIGIRTEAQMVKDYWLEPVSGKHRVEKVKGDIIIGGGRIVGAPIKIKNAVIYPFGRLFQ